MLLNIAKAFLMGGFICMLGQLVINFTHLTNGKILVMFLIIGAILQGFGLYQPLIDVFGAGASVPISGFGCSLVNGALDGIRAEGFFGAIKGGLQATAPGIATAIIFGYINALLFRPRTKKK